MPCIVLAEEPDVVPWLTRMRLPRSALLEILEMTVGERANVTNSDPVTTPGMEIWRWGTRFCRDDPRLLDLGWVACRHDQIEGIRNDYIGIKLVICNTDSHTGIPSKRPKNVADKGAAAIKLIENNSGQSCFPFFEPDERSPIGKYDFWYFCIHAGEGYVSAEISRPDLIVANTIRSFSHRIILCKPGEMEGLRRLAAAPEDFAKVEMPTLIRKK